MNKCSSWPTVLIRVACPNTYLYTCRIVPAAIHSAGSLLGGGVLAVVGLPFSLLGGPGNPRLCGAAVTAGHRCRRRAFIHILEGRNRRFSCASAPKASSLLSALPRGRELPCLARHWSLALPHCPPLSHLISEVSPGLTLPSRDSDSGPRRQGSRPCLPQHAGMLASSIHSNMADGFGTLSGVPWFVETRCCTGPRLQYPARPWRHALAEPGVVNLQISICPGACTSTLSQTAPDWRYVHTEHVWSLVSDTD
jgi:hypothetical protein